MFFQPLAIGIRCRHIPLDLFVRNNTSLFRIDQEHLPRLEAPLAQDAGWFNLQHSGFGRHDDQIIRGNVIA